MVSLRAGKMKSGEPGRDLTFLRTRNLRRFKMAATASSGLASRPITARMVADRLASIVAFSRVILS